jgi:hypothetical protein
LARRVLGCHFHLDDPAGTFQRRRAPEDCGVVQQSIAPAATEERPTFPRSGAGAALPERRRPAWRRIFLTAGRRRGEGSEAALALRPLCGERGSSNNVELSLPRRQPRPRRHRAAGPGIRGAIATPAAGATTTTTATTTHAVLQQESATQGRGRQEKVAPCRPGRKALYGERGERRATNHGGVVAPARRGAQEAHGHGDDEAHVQLAFAAVLEEPLAPKACAEG